jgi:hypothetical protein
MKSMARSTEIERTQLKYCTALQHVDKAIEALRATDPECASLLMLQIVQNDLMGKSNCYFRVAHPKEASLHDFLNIAC